MEKKHKKSITEEQGKIIIQRMFSVVRGSLQLDRMKSYSYEKVGSSTGIIYDDRMSDYSCLWDPNSPERPDRFTSVLSRLKELNLLNRCVDLKPVMASEEDVCTYHDKDLVKELEKISKFSSTKEMKEAALRYDRTYFHPNIYNCALLAAGCSIELTKSVFKGKLKNGMAIIRPPGHNALPNEFSGYGYFNNAVLSAKAALELGAERIIIVDWDAHHGNGIQRAFYDDRRVLYFSIHRYDHGQCWPHLKESDINYTGANYGQGYNINFPLNTPDNSDSEYLAIFHQILMPVAQEFHPELVIVSSGYNAAVGCIEGNQLVSPACFAHLTHNVCSLANGKVVILLEGGYFIPSLAEGAAQTLMSLLGDKIPRLPDPFKKPNQSILETIKNLKYILKENWSCFQNQPIEEEETKSSYWLGPPETASAQASPSLKREPSVEDKFNEIISEQIRLLRGDSLQSNNQLCFSTDDEKLHPDFLNDSSERVLWLRPQKALAEELEWLSMNGLEISISSSSLYASGCIFNVLDNIVNGHACTGISLIDHTRQTGISDVSPVYGKLKHSIKRSLSLILNDGMITPKLNSVKTSSDESLLRFNILHDHDETNPFNESDLDDNKYDVTLRFAEYKGPVDSDYLYLIYRLILPIAYEYRPDIIYVYSSLGSGALTAIGFSHIIHALSALANGRILAIFEGSCNPFDNPRSLLRSVKTLLKDAMPNLDSFRPSQKNSEIVEKSRRRLQARWKSLEDI